MVVARHLVNRQLVRRLAARAASRVCAVSAQQESAADAFPRPAEQAGRAGANCGDIHRADRVERQHDLCDRLAAQLAGIRCCIGFERIVARRNAAQLAGIRRRCGFVELIVL